MSDERPDLKALLEHYNVAVHDRKRQMVKCPLHEDKTPSNSVNLDKGVWNCKSCGEAGDSYTLIEKMEDTNFVGARAFAASLGLSTGDSGGGSDDLPRSGYAGGRKLSSRKGDRPSRGKYVPAWRRP